MKRFVQKRWMARKWNVPAYIAIVISVLSLGVTSYQVWKTEKFQSLTVRPTLRFHYEADDRADVMGLSVSNVGQGAAIVRAVRIFVDGSEVKNWDEAIARAQLGNKEAIGVFALDPDEIIHPGEGLRLLGRPTYNQEGLALFRDFIDQHLAVEITYCSIDDYCRSKCSMVGRCGTKMRVG